MFSAAECGLVVLCESSFEAAAREDDGAALLCDEQLPPESKRWSHVCFDAPDTSVSRHENKGVAEVRSEAACNSSEHEDDADRAFTDELERRLALAERNKHLNSKVFRYGEPSPIALSRKRVEDEQAEAGSILRAIGIAREAPPETHATDDDGCGNQRAA